MTVEGLSEDWVPATCTLPSVDRPLRVAEFDALFAGWLLGVERVAPDRLRLVLDARVEAEVRELAARETECCSFFTFGVDSRGDERLVVEVAVPAAHVGVLDALAIRAQREGTR